MTRVPGLVLPGYIAASLVSPVEGAQVQPAGIDLRVAEIHVPATHGAVTVESRRLPEYREIKPIDDSWHLGPGAYVVRFREIVEVPNNFIGLCYPRSSLLRMGADLRCAVWDPGYKGRGQALLIVYNHSGLELEKNTRIAQIIFIKLLSLPRETYSGAYQGEGVYM